MRKDTYLFERDYQIKSNGAFSNISKWSELIGGLTIESLHKEYKEIELYLKGCDYGIKDSFANNEYTYILKLYVGKKYKDEQVSSDFYSNEIFYPFYIPFIKLAKYYSKLKYGSSLIKYFDLGLEKEIFKHLFPIATRTLIKELKLCKDELEGVTEQEKYNFFLVNFLNNDNYIIELFDFYPLLLRCLLDKIVSIIEFFNNLNFNWQNDKNTISKEMKLSCLTIKQIEIVGDFHNGNVATTKISLNDGNALFYKPHSLATAKMYYSILNDLYAEYGFSTLEYPIIDRVEYGWEMGIKYKTCQSKYEIQRFYIRLGIQIMLNYLLDIQDLHYENLIAYGEHPVFIDIEIMCGNIKKYHNNLTAKEMAEFLLSSSVLGSGILPYPNTSNSIFCSLIGKGGIKTNRKVVKIINSMSSTIHLSYTYAVTRDQLNRPSIKNMVCKYSNFVENIIQGFAWAYRYIERNSFMLENKISFAFSRLLLKNTQSYSKMLQISYEPIFLTDGGERQLILSKYYNDVTNEDKAIFQSELSALLKGDIPYFSCWNNDKKLYLNKTGEYISNYLYITPDKYLKMRLNSLCENDYKFQSNLLCNALNLERKCFYPELLKNIALKREGIVCNVLKSCEMIGDYLINIAIKNYNFTDAIWIENKKEVGISLSNMYLYDGIAGIAIFFAALSQKIKKKSYQIMEKNLIDKLVKYTLSDLDSQKSYMTGAFAGESSIIYTYIILYYIKKDMKYIKYAELHEKKMHKLLQNDSKYDFLLGNAGAIIVFLKLFKITSNKKYLCHAKEAADYLILKAIASNDGIYWPTANSCIQEGLAHGESGFSLCFAELYKETHDYKYLKIALNALMFENSLYDDKSNNWVDEEHKKNKNTRAYWCHGAGGIALTRKLLLHILDNNALECISIDYYNALKRIEKSTNYNMNSFCLCHGLCGNLFILYYLYGKKWKEKYIEYVNRFCASIKLDTLEILENNNPGFMTGLSGIGYFLLAIKDKSLPNVLCLEPW